MDWHTLENGPDAKTGKIPKLWEFSQGPRLGTCSAFEPCLTLWGMVRSFMVFGLFPLPFFFFLLLAPFHCVTVPYDRKSTELQRCHLQESTSQAERQCPKVGVKLRFPPLQTLGAKLFPDPGKLPPITPKYSGGVPTTSDPKTRQKYRDTNECV